MHDDLSNSRLQIQCIQGYIHPHFILAFSSSLSAGEFSDYCVNLKKYLSNNVSGRVQYLAKPFASVKRQK